ncbi:Pleckstrin homology domain-containing protein [Pyronema omphalodes]|nr:Pleckstrin homology domain-containing protein [Pyronema omphalodes]
MSDPVVKPEETVVAVDAPKVEETAAPAVEATPAVEEAKPEETTEQKEEEAPKEEKPEPKAITHGTLSKAHGGLLSFFKSKRFFYFQEEPITEEALKSYLHKDSASKATAAYALQTGKGLCFYSKDEANKQPHGIIKLADVTEVTESGANKFVLKMSSGDLHFEALASERDSWVFTLKAKIAEAKATVDEVLESEGYKATIERLTKPAVPAKPAAVKTEEAKAEETEEAKPAEEAKPETAAPEEVTSDAEASDAKAEIKRTPSKKNKRISAFNAASFFGKKEKAEEKKAEDKKDEAAPAVEGEAAPADATEAPAAPAPGVTEPVATEAATEAKADEEAKPEEAKPTEETRPEPAANKHNRRSFFARFGKREESAAAEDKKEEAAAEGEEKKAEEAKPAETPASPSAGVLSFFSKREKSPAPKAALATEEPPHEVKLEAKVDPEAPAAESSEAAAAAPATEEAAAAVEGEEKKEETKPVTSPKEKRISSFFNFGKGKAVEEKKPEEVKSDSEDAEAPPKTATSPVPKSGFLGGLKRKVSKAGKADKPETKDVNAPAPVAEEEATEAAAAETTTAEAVKEEETKTEEQKPAETQAIGDVVPEAVTVGANPVQATA